MSNLLSKASIVLTPTAYSDGTLHSVKPLQTLGSELVTNGDFATDSDWVKGSGWSIANGVATSDGVSSNSNLSQQNILTLNKFYKVSVDVVLNSGILNVYVTSNPTKIITSSGSYTFYGLCNRPDLDLHFKSVNFEGSIDNVSVKEVIDADFDFTRSTTATRENSSGNIESVAANLPRIDYLGGTGHILLEPQSTNKLTQSETFSTWSLNTALLTSSLKKIS